MSMVVSVMLHAIFPSIANVPDAMGSKSALSTAGMVCFLVYWYLFRRTFINTYANSKLGSSIAHSS